VSISSTFRGLRSSAPFWSLRYHAETSESLSVRQDTVEPPRLSIDRGAMLTAVTAGGFGYCATSDLSQTGLQAALDRASTWALATRGKSVVRFDPARMPAPRGGYQSKVVKENLNSGAIHDMLAEECKRAKIDERIVERVAALSLIEEERVYLTNTGGELRQRFRFTLPHMRVTANQGVVTQSRSLEHAQQGGFEQVERAGFAGCGARLADEALRLLAAPNCPSGKMDVLLMPDQMMLQVHESIGASAGARPHPRRRAQLRRDELRDTGHVRLVSVRIRSA
jgi:predicted Zn-dependent protease